MSQSISSRNNEADVNPNSKCNRQPRDLYGYSKSGPNSLFSDISAKIAKEIDTSIYDNEPAKPPSERAISGYTGYRKKN